MVLWGNANKLPICCPYKPTSDDIKHPSQLSSQPFATSKLYWENTQSRLAEADRPRSPASNPAIHPTLTHIRGLILGQGLDYQPIRRWGKEAMSRDKRERTKPVERLGQILVDLLRSDRSASRRQWTGQSSLPQPKPATLIFFFFYIFLSKKLQHQPGFVYFHFSWLWDQTVLFLSLQNVTGSLECQQSGSEGSTDENRDGLSWGSQANREQQTLFSSFE